MSLINNYLKRLGRPKDAEVKTGCGSVPPALHRIQEESGRSNIRRKIIRFASLVVGVSFFAYSLVSLSSLLIYPSVDESVAVEVISTVSQEGKLQVTGSDSIPSQLEAKNGVEVAAIQDSNGEGVASGGSTRIGQEAAPTQSIFGSTEQVVVGRQMKTDKTDVGTGTIYEPQPLTDASQIQIGDGRNHNPRDKKSAGKILIKESVYTPDYLYQLALQAQQSQKFGRAERYYKMVLSEKPRHEDCLINLAAIYIQERRFEEAHSLLDKVIHINPENAKALVNIGVIELKMDRKEAANEYFRRALQCDPVEKTALMNLAYLAKLDNQYDEAAGYFEKLVRVEPENREILLGYAGIEEKRQEYGSAMILYRKCLNQMTMQDNPEKYEAISTRIQILKHYAQTKSF